MIGCSNKPNWGEFSFSDKEKRKTLIKSMRAKLSFADFAAWMTAQKAKR